MIKKCISSNSDYSQKEYNAVVCGVNIKPISKKNKKVKTFLGISAECEKTKWGIFVHCRLDDGDQYDAIFELENSYLLKNGGVCPFVKRLRKGSKSSTLEKNKYTTAVIPAIFKIFGVNEWVELIGSKTILIQEHLGMSIGVSGYYDKTGMKVLPDYYEYHTNDKNLIDAENT